MFKKIFKHGSAYFLVSLLTKFTGFILLPIITRYLSLDEYGLYTNIQSAQQILYIFGTLALDSAYGRYIYDYNSSHKRLRLLTSTIVTVFTVWSVVYILLSIPTLYLLVDSWGHTSLLIAFLVPFISLFQQFSALNISLMQSRHNTKKLLTITTIAYFVTQVFMLTMLTYLELKVVSFYISQFLVGFIVMTIHLKLMRKEGLIRLLVFNKITFKKNISYAIGYIPASLSSWIFMVSDRYIITYFISIAMAGKYAFIVQITMIIQVIMQSIQTAQTPIFIQQMKTATPDSFNKIKNYTNVIIFLLLCIYLIMVIALPLVIELIFPDNYHGDYLLIPILAMGAVFLAIRKMFANFLVYFKRSLWISASGYIPAIINLTLNFIFIPMYGIYAAAWTTLFSLFSYACVVFFMAQKLCKINYDYLKIVFMFALATVSTVVVLYYEILFLNIIVMILFIYSGSFLGIYKQLRN